MTRIASGGSKFLDLDNNDKAAAWMIGFAAQAEIENVTSDAPLKQLFLAKCDVDAISRLQSLLFPLNVDDTACNFDSIKAAVRCITHPTDKFLVAERMTLLTMEQHVGEHPHDFMVRINNQAALCDLAKLATNLVQEITKLVYLAGLSDSDLKLRLLEHLQSNENASVMDLVSLASIASSQRSFAHKEALSERSPAFHAALNIHLVFQFILHFCGYRRNSSHQHCAPIAALIMGGVTVSQSTKLVSIVAK